MAWPTIGLALGSGGAKGFAHIGVLRALEENGIPVGVLAGTSMGALVAALYATGISPHMMEGLAAQLRRRYWLDFTVPKMGLIGGTKVHHLMSLLTHFADFSQTRIPLAIVATDLTQKRLVTFTSGLVADAVRASISIPGVFVPFIHQGGVYVDGGVLERVPVAAARRLGGQVILGVDVAATPRNAAPETIVDVIVQSLDMMQRPLAEVGADAADVWIKPEVGDIGTSHFERVREAAQMGYQATVEQLEQIRVLLGKQTGDSGALHQG